ncbi:FG-GAP repeat protein [Nannocystis sp. ILAH1]|uniref:FG-GAP repeat protein n=1 Tax=Nannocystis sp. ILAH1 TaxID=2996789 RepID=UPI002270AC20|nr:FG-GAP repeat protein [Nannocystis sp. ILAH1]MCY0986664.1 FG-GAP repeat protein [Nannocystis sp. ILAH1]
MSVMYRSLIAIALGIAFVPAPGLARGPDFDLDGYEDLAIGAWGEWVSSIQEAGMVNVLYGSSSGLEAPVDRLTSLWQDLADAEGASEETDEFGRALAWGDFNGDCYDDLAVGVPSENVEASTGGQRSNAGAVQVFYGSSTGLRVTDDLLLTRESTGIPGDAYAADFFGNVLGAGDFNGDGFHDLAIGARDAQPPALGDGAMVIVYGGSTGLSGTNGPGAHKITPPTNAGQPDVMATGDFNCDSYEDLAFSEYGYNGNGRVDVIYGSATGLSASAGPGMESFVPNHQAGYGTALAAGNFNGDTLNGIACIDLAIGAPLGNQNAGFVDVLYGTSASGLQTAAPLWDQISQDWGSMEGVGQADTDQFQYFGRALTAGRIDRDAYHDLVIGAPAENDGRGVIHVVRGTLSGLVDTDNQMWDQDSAFVPDAPEAGDYFGELLTCGNFTGERPDDIGVYTRNEYGTGLEGHGSVQVLYTSNSSVPTLDAGEQWNQGLIDTQLMESDDHFGSALTPSRPIPSRIRSQCVM